MIKLFTTFDETFQPRGHFYIDTEHVMAIEGVQDAKDKFSYLKMSYQWQNRVFIVRGDITEVYAYLEDDPSSPPDNYFYIEPNITEAT